MTGKVCTMNEVSTRQIGLPKYLHVANVLRDRISSGEYAPGQQVPSDYELSEIFGYDRATVRRGVRQLRQEGLVYTEHGKGTFVRARRLIRHEILGIMRAEWEHAKAGTMPDRGLFELTTGTPEGAVYVDIRYEVVPANGDLADAFGIDEGTDLLRRVYTFNVDGKPHQISYSYLLHDMLAGTRLTDPANERPGRGTMAQLAEIGVVIEHAKMDIHARMPSPEEMTLLGMSEGTPVMIDRRTSFADGRVVVVSDTVSPADQIMYGIDVRLDHL